MSKKVSCPDPLPEGIDRRSFFKKSVTATAAGAALGLSFEEQNLQAAPSTPKVGEAVATLPTGKIGDVEISRLICGGNLVSGYAHSRDLIYVSSLLKNYFTDQKILDTWQICEENGVNTMIVNPRDERAVQLFQRYKKERGGKMQWLAQAAPSKSDVKGVIKKAVDNQAVGVLLVGNLGDRWTFDDRLDLVDEFVQAVNEQGVISGVAGHSLDMLIAVESAGIENDFFMKTLHHNNYWSSRKPDQNKRVIENWGTDNYYDMTPEETIDFMKEVKKPWIAYKVLAAGAIKPRDGFDFAFKNGADFACVGMFDFQVAEDVKIANEILPRHGRRARAWCA